MTVVRLLRRIAVIAAGSALLVGCVERPHAPPPIRLDEVRQYSIPGGTAVGGMSVGDDGSPVAWADSTLLLTRSVEDTAMFAIQLPDTMTVQYLSRCAFPRSEGDIPGVAAHRRGTIRVYRSVRGIKRT